MEGCGYPRGENGMSDGDCDDRHVGAFERSELDRGCVGFGAGGYPVASDLGCGSSGGGKRVSVLIGQASIDERGKITGRQRR